MVQFREGPDYTWFGLERCHCVYTTFIHTIHKYMHYIHIYIQYIHTHVNKFSEPSLIRHSVGPEESVSSGGSWITE